MPAGGSHTVQGVCNLCVAYTHKVRHHRSSPWQLECLGVAVVRRVVCVAVCTSVGIEETRELED